MVITNLNISRNEAYVLNKKQQTTLLKNSLLLLLLVIACAILSRCALKGETLSEYEQKQQNMSSISKPTEDEISPPNTDVSNELFESSTAGIPSDAFSKESISQKPAELNTNKLPQTPTEEPMADRVTYQNGFYYESLNSNVINRITGCSYPADDTNCQISIDELRYVSVLYYNFDDKIKTGELICNKAIAQDLVEIFYELYLAEYPIEKIRLVDEYSADDELSMADNNTSCFNYRVIAGTSKLSNHSYGMAIDINPFFNPYVTFPNGEPHASPTGSEYYIDRDKDFAYKITTDDPAYKLFTEHGFTWGGNWKSSKDYQHFEKKLP